MRENDKVKVIPCSGMGKVYGLMAREAALHTVRKLCPEAAETVCLAYLVTGDGEAGEIVNGKPCITIDGCPLMCASKSVGIMGGEVKLELKVLDVMKQYRGARPGTATELSEEGWPIVEAIARQVHTQVQAIQGEGGADHGRQ